MSNTVCSFCCVLFLLLGLRSSVDSALTFYSEESTYVLLEDESNTFNYNDWKRKCGELGGGFIPAVINSVTEFKVIGANIQGESGSFWIGGSTNNGGNGLSMQYFDYLTTDAGYRRVIIESDMCGNSTVSQSYQLKSKSASDFENGILCETEGSSFQSDTSLYQKLVSSTRQSREYWTAKCADIGPGWIPTVLTSETEYNFIQEKQRALSDNQDYFIAGTTRTVGTIEWENYLLYQIGNDVRIVYVSTLNNGSQDNENFRILTSSSTQTLHGILCENDGLLYQSESSRYRRLSSVKQFNYGFWNERCLELGSGWHPAFADDAAEFEFIQEQERISTDDRSYWIGGWFNETLKSRGFSEDRYAWLMSKGQGSTNDLSTLEVELQSVQTHGILCEVSKYCELKSLQAHCILSEVRKYLELKSLKHILSSKLVCKSGC